MSQAAPPFLVLFGGTFNPIHEGHLGLIRGLLHRPGVGRLFVIPTGSNPFKAGEPLLPVALRVRMVRAAVAGLPRVSVLELETQGPQPSYTIDTVTTLSRQHPGVSLALVLGWDVYREFPRWRAAPAILEKATLWVVLRAGAPPPASGGTLAGLPAAVRQNLHLDAGGRAVETTGRVVVEFLDFQLPDVSSTQVRDSRSLERVPPGAREILAAFWRDHQQP